jgi:hypothetical protein
VKKQKIKDTIIELLRGGLSLTKAAAAVGVSLPEVFRWIKKDKEFGYALNAAILAQAYQFILVADDLVRSGHKLTKRQERTVKEVHNLVAPADDPAFFNSILEGAARFHKKNRSSGEF